MRVYKFVPLQLLISRQKGDAAVIVLDKEDLEFVVDEIATRRSLRSDGFWRDLEVFLREVIKGEQDGNKNDQETFQEEKEETI